MWKLGLLSGNFETCCWAFFIQITYSISKTSDKSAASFRNSKSCKVEVRKLWGWSRCLVIKLEMVVLAEVTDLFQTSNFWFLAFWPIKTSSTLLERSKHSKNILQAQETSSTFDIGLLKWPYFHSVYLVGGPYSLSDV